MSTPSINASFGIVSSSTAPSRHIGTSPALWAGASIAAAALLTAAGFLAVRFQPPAVPHSSVSAQVPIVIQHAHKAVSPPASMEIVVQPATGSPVAFFEGTGLGSAGGSPPPFFEGTGD